MPIVFYTTVIVEIKHNLNSLSILNDYNIDVHDLNARVSEALKSGIERTNHLIGGTLGLITDGVNLSRGDCYQPEEVFNALRQFADVGLVHILDKKQQKTNQGLIQALKDKTFYVPTPRFTNTIFGFRYQYSNLKQYEYNISNPIREAAK